MDLQIGSTIGDYQILAVLGAGGMGSVYQVRNLISDRVEALKVLLADLSGQPDLAERFQREIKVQGSLDHPNIAQLRTAFRSGNQLLMVMEYVDGLTLEKLLHDHGPLPVKMALDVISQVLSALEFAHAHGVIHRDIKPANMILTRAGVVKLMDFGIAKAATDHKLTMTGTTMGSIYYMSPEQIQGSPNLDARADLYSVGVTLYQLVTGKRPFDGDSQYAIMAAHLQTTPVPPVQIDPRLPPVLNDMILMSVAKDPNGRFQTAGAFRNALAGLLNTLPSQEPLPAPPPTPIQQTPTPASVPTQASPLPPTAAAVTAAPTPIPTVPQTPVPPAAQQAIPPTTPMYAQQPQAIPPTTPMYAQQPQAIPPTTPMYAQQPQAIPPTTPMYAQQPMPQAGVPMAMPAQKKSNRVVWMALGGIAAAAVIVAAIEFVPWKGVNAGGNKPIAGNVTPLPTPISAPTPLPNQTPTPIDVVTPPPGPNGGSGSGGSGFGGSGSGSGGSLAIDKKGGVGSSGGALRPTPAPPRPTPAPPTPTPAPPQPTPTPVVNTGGGGSGSAPAGPSREQIMQAREHMAKLRVRADTVRSSLLSLKRSMAPNNLNAKFTGPEGLMNTYMRAADDALNHDDLPVFRDYAEKAEHQIETLEKLLNL